MKRLSENNMRELQGAISAGEAACAFGTGFFAIVSFVNPGVGFVGGLLVSGICAALS